MSSESDPIRKAKLPASGQVPFLPPKTWKPGQALPRGLNNGYLDRFGREWIKGRSITPGQPFEWDVQINEGADHINVDLNSNVSH